jgi:hypothetical protein
METQEPHGREIAPVPNPGDFAPSLGKDIQFPRDKPVLLVFLRHCGDPCKLFPAPFRSYHPYHPSNLPTHSLTYPLKSKSQKRPSDSSPTSQTTTRKSIALPSPVRSLSSPIYLPPFLHNHLKHPATLALFTPSLQNTFTFTLTPTLNPNPQEGSAYLN